MTRWGPFYVFFCFSLFIFVSNFQFKTTPERPKWPKQVKSFKASQGRSPIWSTHYTYFFCSKSQNLNIRLHFWPNNSGPSLLAGPPELQLIFYIFVLINNKSGAPLFVVNNTTSVFLVLILFKHHPPSPSKCKIPS